MWWCGSITFGVCVCVCACDLCEDIHTKRTYTHQMLCCRITTLTSTFLTNFKISNFNKWQEDEEENVRSYWMTLRTGEDIHIWRRRLWIALCANIVLEEALNLSSDRILNESMNFNKEHMSSLKVIWIRWEHVGLFLSVLMWKFWNNIVLYIKVYELVCEIQRHSPFPLAFPCFYVIVEKMWNKICRPEIYFWYLHL